MNNFIKRKVEHLKTSIHITNNFLGALKPLSIKPIFENMKDSVFKWRSGVFNNSNFDLWIVGAATIDECAGTLPW